MSKKKWWFMTVLVVILAVVSGCSGNNETETTTAPPVEEMINEPEPAVEETATTTHASEEDLEAAPTETEEAKAENEIPGTIGMTPEEFKEAFNAAAKEFDSNFRIGNITVEDGPVQDTFTVHLTDHLAIVGSVNKADGSVRDVLIMGQGDGSLSSGLDIMVAMGILIAATNPELTPEERGKVLEDLGLFDDTVDLTDHTASTIRNGIQYTLTASDMIGIVFSAGDANDN